MPFKIRRPLPALTVFDLNGAGGAGHLGDFEPMQVKFHSCNGGAQPAVSSTILPRGRAVETTQGTVEVGSPAQELSQSADAWMQLKLLLALVIEKLCYHARFSPGVYRLEPLAGRVLKFVNTSPLYITDPVIIIYVK
jgi:hypothetical protein